MKFLKEATASQRISLGPIVGTDATTPYTTALANTEIKLFKHGAQALADKNSGGSTHMASGIHYATFDATDTNTLGQLDLFVVVSGQLIFKDSFRVVPAEVYDALHSNTGAGLRSLMVSTDPGAITALSFDEGAIDAAAIATDVGPELALAHFDTAVEGNVTFAEATRLMLAVLTGVTTVSGATYTIKTHDGVSTRVTYTLNSSKERTAVTLNP